MRLIFARILRTNQGQAESGLNKELIFYFWVLLWRNCTFTIIEIFSVLFQVISKSDIITLQFRAPSDVAPIDEPALP